MNWNAGGGTLAGRSASGEGLVGMRKVCWYNGVAESIMLIELRAYRWGEDNADVWCCELYK